MAAPPSFEFTYLATHSTNWDPSSMEVFLNVTLDGCIVPSEAQGARISLSHLIVLDGLVDDITRRQLVEFLVGDKNNNKTMDASTVLNTAADADDVEGLVEEGDSLCEVEAAPKAGDKEQEEQKGVGVKELPSDRWERRTADMAGAAPTWGLKQHVLESLASGNPPAIVEIQSRLAKLYPEYEIAHLPSSAIQSQEEEENKLDEANEEEEEEGLKLPPQKRVKRPIENNSKSELEKGGDRGAIAKSSSVPGSADPPSAHVDCSAFLANAAAEGDTFRFHVDADPTSFPPSPWTDQFGDYFNGEPGKPLLVTLLLYLDDTWERDWGGETLFLDGATDAGVFVRPRAGRAVLMEQDVLHRVTPPSSVAEGRLRLSLVWKLVFLPRKKGEEVRLARREWGVSSAFGSAAKVEAVKRQLAIQERKRSAVTLK